MFGASCSRFCLIFQKEKRGSRTTRKCENVINCIVWLCPSRTHATLTLGLQCFVVAVVVLKDKPEFTASSRDSYLKKNRCPSLKCTDIQMLGRRVYVPVVPEGAFNGNITFKHRAVLDRITDRLEGGDRAAAMSNVCLCWKAWAAITKYFRLKHKSVLFFQASLSWADLYCHRWVTLKAVLAPVRYSWNASLQLPIYSSGHHCVVWFCSWIYKWGQRGIEDYGFHGR